MSLVKPVRSRFHRMNPSMNDPRVPGDGAAGEVDGIASASRPLLEADMASRIVPVIEEQIDVRKQVVDQGGYRLSKKVSIRHETVDEPLISRSVQIERRVVGRLLPSMESPPARHEGDTLIISVVEEVLVTEKRLMLKEEIHVTQTQATIHRPVNVALRSEEILIEPLEPRDAPGSTSS
jgi:uncharacterized protein (TIGR02271 family)